MAYVDNYGLAALSMRALGSLLEVDPTALYRHFPNKDSLLEAMIDKMFGEVYDQIRECDGTPRERLMAVAKACRAAFKRHPDIGIAMISVEGTHLKNALVISHRSIQALHDMGVAEHDVVLRYQMLEHFMLGSCIFDFTGAPHNFDMRRARYRAYELPEFDAVARSAKNVEAAADEAFEAGFNTLLDACEALAAKPAKK